ncbi:MAG: cytochrome c maturation protein CcmE [Bacteroidia bacterium]|nr:cytochrome c maturation protein CcmE [Bacteroidia bacterium]
MKLKSIIGLLILAGFITLLIINFAGSTSIYTTFADAKQRGSDVHIVASWVRRDEAKYDPAQDIFQFYLQDSTNNTQLVIYRDPKPANFEQADKVVIIGKYQGDVFEAEKILMKCPSKYNHQEL